MDQQRLDFGASLKEQEAAVSEALEPIDAEIAELSQKLHGLAEERNNALRKTPVQCPCGAVSQVGQMVYYQTHYYVSPRGCNEGDYWLPGEGQTDCPTCKARLRLYNCLDLEKLKPLYLKVVDEHNRN